MTDIGMSAGYELPDNVRPESVETERAPRSYIRQIVLDVMRRRTARAGLFWVGLLVVLSVFSPFIASSHPILMQRAGRWTSPLLHHLAAADVVLQICFWLPLILYFFRGYSVRFRSVIWASIVAISMIVLPFLIRPPQIIVYETYRTDLGAGTIQRAYFTLIPYSPDDHLRDQPEMRLTAPSSQHWMGTTSDSADLLSNLIAATRIALSIGFISAGIAVVIGVVIGGLMGYFAGVIDLLGMRLVEIFDAIPTLLLLLIFVAVFTPNLYIMMAIIGATTWAGYAYFIRAEFLSLRDRDFVHAARAAGLPLRSILFRHMLPNGVTPVIVTASFGVASAILYESTLSFLGIGLVNESSWGNLLNEALGEGGTFYWWIAVYPGLVIFITVFAYNLIGEALRDALDPKLQV